MELGLPVVLGARQQPSLLCALPGEQQLTINPILCSVPAQTPGTWTSGALTSPVAPAGHRRGVCRDCAQTYPLTLSEGIEVLKGMWNDKQLGDVTLDLLQMQS